MHKMQSADLGQEERRELAQLVPDQVDVVQELHLVLGHPVQLPIHVPHHRNELGALLVKRPQRLGVQLRPGPGPERELGRRFKTINLGHEMVLM